LLLLDSPTYDDWIGKKGSRYASRSVFCDKRLRLLDDAVIGHAGSLKEEIEGQTDARNFRTIQRFQKDTIDSPLLSFQLTEEGTWTSQSENDVRVIN